MRGVRAVLYASCLHPALLGVVWVWSAADRRIDGDSPQNLSVGSTAVAQVAASSSVICCRPIRCRHLMTARFSRRDFSKKPYLPVVGAATAGSEEDHRAALLRHAGCAQCPQHRLTCGGDAGRSSQCSCRSTHGASPLCAVVQPTHPAEKR